MLEESLGEYTSLLIVLSGYECLSTDGPMKNISLLAYFSTFSRRLEEPRVMEMKPIDLPLLALPWRQAVQGRGAKGGVACRSDFRVDKLMSPMALWGYRWSKTLLEIPY